jgi:hypothetical protein
MQKHPLEVIYEIRNFSGGKNNNRLKEDLSDVSSQPIAAQSREQLPLHFLA